MKKSKTEHLKASDEHKRILSLAGGGMRGLITLGVLAQLERKLKDEMRDEDYGLHDHFDLIAGTSTGSILLRVLH